MERNQRVVKSFLEENLNQYFTTQRGLSCGNVEISAVQSRDPEIVRHSQGNKYGRSVPSSEYNKHERTPLENCKQQPLYYRRDSKLNGSSTEKYGERNNDTPYGSKNVGTIGDCYGSKSNDDRSANSSHFESKSSSKCYGYSQIDNNLKNIDCYSKDSTSRNRDSSIGYYDKIQGRNSDAPATDRFSNYNNDSINGDHYDINCDPRNDDEPPRNYSRNNIDRFRSNTISNHSAADTNRFSNNAVGNIGSNNDDCFKLNNHAARNDFSNEFMNNGCFKIDHRSGNNRFNVSKNNDYPKSNSYSGNNYFGTNKQMYTNVSEMTTPTFTKMGRKITATAKPDQSVKSDATVSKKPRRRHPADARRTLYQKAKFILEKIAKNEANDTVDERDEVDKAKYTKIVEEYDEKKHSLQNDANRPSTSKRERSRVEEDKPAKRRKVKESSRTTITAKRPFNEVVKDNLMVALANTKTGKLAPITVSEWSKVESKLSELVIEHVLAKKGSPFPHYDSSEIHRGFRVIKCMDEFSKGFLKKSIALISDAWDDISLKLIPAQEIPQRPRARIWLPKIKGEGPQLLECLQAMNPTVPMDDWTVIRKEPPNDNSMSLVLAITEAGATAVKEAGGKLLFGMREAKIKILDASGTDSHSSDGEKDEDDAENDYKLLDQLHIIT